jgi:hypothetical protein
MNDKSRLIEALRTAKWHTLIECISVPMCLHYLFMAVLRQLRPQVRMLARLTPNGVGYPMLCFEPSQSGPKVVFAALSPQLLLGPTDLPQDEVDALDASSRAEACRADVAKALKSLRPIVAKLKKGNFTREDLDAHADTPEHRERMRRMLDATRGPLVTINIGGRPTRLGGEPKVPVALIEREPGWWNCCRVVAVDRNCNWIVAVDDPTWPSPSKSEIEARAMNEIASERLRLAFALTTSVRLYVRIAETMRSGRLSMLVEEVEFPDGIGLPVNQALLRAQLPLFRIETSAEGTSGSEFAVVDAPFAASLWQSVPKDGARRAEASVMST